MARESTKRITSIGGQALIEGIMMRGPVKTDIAVRAQDGTIVHKEFETGSLKKKHPILALPLLRGIAGFIDSLSVGFDALSYSAEQSGMDEEEESSKFDLWLEKKLGDKMMKVLIGISTVLGVLLAIGLFFFLPVWLFNLVSSHAVWLAPWRSLVEGAMRIAIFLAYLILCTRMPEIRRVFQYHGAEHKTIFCYENEEELTVENVKKHTRFHPRCGTSFLVIMLILGIIVGFFIPFTNPFLRTITKLLCVPLIMGIGYELIKICGRYDNWVTRVISAPGLWVQRITTKEPDDSMIEVAIEAMKRVIPENGEDLYQK